MPVVSGRLMESIRREECVANTTEVALDPVARPSSSNADTQEVLFTCLHPRIATGSNSLLITGDYGAAQGRKYVLTTNAKSQTSIVLIRDLSSMRSPSQPVE
jgi:hypothetical protein